jgi:murein DD-endopeptidase MepM/ murein hydrolase activator NlpD
LSIIGAALVLGLTFAAGRIGAQGQVYSHVAASRLADQLGLGTRMAATLMLNGGFPDSWARAAGGLDAPGYLQWPIPGHRIGRGFGSDGGRHEASDITADQGTKVHAMAPGLVGYSDSELKGYGKTVMVMHPGGWVTLYAHLHEFKCEPGQLITRGDVIGTVGSTGVSRGNHLHFALLVRGKAVDPMKYMRGAPDQRMILSMAEPIR